MLHIREDLSDEELQRLSEKVEREHGLKLHAIQSSKPHLHFVSTESPPHVALRAIREQGYHACLVDL
jgi:hypothetical protein